MFKEIFIPVNEEFDQTPHIKAAKAWLDNKYKSEEYDYVHKPLLKDAGTKTFHVSTGGNQFVIVAKKADTEYENPQNTIIFKIVSDEDEPEKEEDQF